MNLFASKYLLDDSFYDFMIIGFCLASDNQVVGVTFPPNDDPDSVPCTFYYYYDLGVDKFYCSVCEGCEDTAETRKNAIFNCCDRLNDLYHEIPWIYRYVMNSDDHCATIRSKFEFNIDINS